MNAAAANTAPEKAAQKAAEPALSLESLSWAIREGQRERRLFNGLSLHIHPGEVVAIAGPSGCGKSSLLQIASGFVTPDEGTVRVMGRQWQQMRFWEAARWRREHLGILPQDLRLIPDESMRSNLRLPLSLHRPRIPRAEQQQMMGRMLERLGLGEIPARRRAARLSGGEQQRLALARAMICTPDLLLADEPTSALDGETARRILRMITELAHDQGSAALLSTHDPVVMRACDRVLHLREGVTEEAAAEAP